MDLQIKGNKVSSEKTGSAPGLPGGRRRPIGIFDSGIGGLTVLKEIQREVPAENIVYFGDTARVPYGTKSKESIIRFSKENVSVLLHHRVKMMQQKSEEHTS